MGKIIEFKNIRKYINLFENYEKTGYVKDIVKGLKFLDSILLKNETIIKNEFSEIVCFYDYFTEKYENNEEVKKEINKQYKKGEPLIFSLAESIIKNSLIKEFLKEYSSLPKEMKRIVNIIIENIFNINEDKGIIIVTRNKNNEFKDRIDINIKKDIAKKDVLFEKERLRYYLSLVIKQDGYIALLTEKEKIYTIRSMSILDYKTTLLSEEKTKEMFFAENAIYKKWQIELE